MAIRGKEQPLGEVLNQLIDTYKLRAKLDEVDLHQYWEVVTGPAIQGATEALYLQGERMMVRVSSAAARAEISLQRDYIVQQLNQQFGSNRIKDIIFI
jgi:predicted nucleic acid-binding Zn ribbon protein